MPRCGIAETLGYVPPELHEGKAYWYIDFYALDPVSGKLKRKRVKCNRVQGAVQRRTWARNAIAVITRKLQQGWTPWVASEAKDEFTLLGDALDLFERMKLRHLRHSSPYSYANQISLFREWARSEDLLGKAVYHFNTEHAMRYLTYVSEVRLVANRTYNTYVMYCRMMWAWMREKQYTTADPWENVRKRKQPKKSRTFLSRSEMQEMLAWIERNDPNFLLPVLWLYYGLIRPGELKRLKVLHMDLDRQVMHVPCEESKSGDARMATIPDAMLQYLQVVSMGSYPPKAWVITCTFLPGEHQIGRNTLNLHWCKMRDALGWPDSKQLYSLRDTGIIDYLRAGVDPLAVMQQAGHKSLATTNEYVKHAFPHGPGEIRVKAVPLRAALPAHGPARATATAPAVVVV